MECLPPDADLSVDGEQAQHSHPVSRERRNGVRRRRLRAGDDVYLSGWTVVRCVDHVLGSVLSESHRCDNHQCR